MNDMTVGMENLPNVFIDQISIESTSEDMNYRIRVILKMFDYADDHSWRNKVAGLKVKCAFVDDDRIVDLNSGDLSLYDINNDTISKVKIQSCDTFRFNNLIAGYENFTTAFEFNTTEPPVNLNVYAACFIDDLEFGTPLFDKFYGPMVGERIYVGGVPNKESGYFYNPSTNEEYGGPVHQHSSGYMEGSMHSDKPHSSLRYVAEENYKMIVDPSVNVEVVIELELEEGETEGPTLTQTEAPDGVPQPDALPTTVVIEDPNIPSGPLTEIYE